LQVLSLNSSISLQRLSQRATSTKKSIDGVLDENVELQAIADSLDQLSKGLVTSKEKTFPSATRKKKSKENEALKAVAMECQKIANYLSTAV